MKNLVITTQEVLDAGRIEDAVQSYHCDALNDMVMKQDLSVSYVLEHVSDEILLTGTISGTVTVECCRCLEKYEQPVAMKFMQSYPATVPEIDVAAEAREQLILDMPEKPLCRTDCAGLCAKCGANWNRQTCSCAPEPHDSRWDILKEVIKKVK